MIPVILDNRVREAVPVILDNRVREAVSVILDNRVRKAVLIIGKPGKSAAAIMWWLIFFGVVRTSTQKDEIFLVTVQTPRY